MNALLELLSGLGTVLDTPGSVARGLLSGEPGRAFGGVFDPEQRVSGREMLGFGENDPESWELGDVAGFGAELVTDPLNLLPGYYGVKNAGKIAGAVGDAGKFMKGSGNVLAGVLADEAGTDAISPLGMSMLIDAMRKKSGGSGKMFDQAIKDYALETPDAQVMARMAEEGIADPSQYFSIGSQTKPLVSGVPSVPEGLGTGAGYSDDFARTIGKTVEEGGYNFEPLKNVRSSFPDMTDEQFNAALEGMRGEELISLRRFEGREGVKPDDYLIPEKKTANKFGFVELNKDKMRQRNLLAMLLGAGGIGAAAGRGDYQ